MGRYKDLQPCKMNLQHFIPIRLKESQGYWGTKDRNLWGKPKERNMTFCEEYENKVTEVVENINS